MASKNVQIVRAYFEHLDQLLAQYWADPVPISEYPLAEEAFTAVSPGAEWKPPFMRETVRGKEAWLALVSAWLEAADDWRISVEEVSDLDNEQVLCTSQNFIRGKDSGAPVHQRIFTVVTVREAQIVLIRDFTERQEAIAAAAS
ncbi:MAG: nuclear transport factor 2 family protein [Isosphaeraceae bacterium]